MKKITGPFLGLIVTASLILAQTAPLPDSPWHFMDTQRIGAYDLLKSHPTFDGRGVIIIICDSGVDMGVQGLLLTSEGKTKVLDAQDFSGQGDIKLQKAKLDSTGYKPALKTESILLYDFDLLPHQPADSIYWVGCLDEKKYFQNAGPKDINNNGKEDDKFGVVTFPISINDEERWVYFVDENGDGSLLDEKPRFDYNINFDTFSFTGRDAQKEKKLYTFALNIRAEERIASFHACDNSHGTHCAGIAAGFQLFGEETLHGIAPGAQVISAKIGDGTLSGGATTTGSMKKAYEYGVKYAKDHNVPVVFSMSYGVDSGIEGRSDIEAFLNKIMQENEQVVIVTSNGNSGPGLSSAGNPSCASRILSVGALLPLGIARDSYGFANDRDRLMHFTSRGGECGKPDIVAPGAAASSVPMHARGENMWGTSMACPQVAGAAAVLISACEQENIPWNGALIKRALKNSAEPLPGYTALDQGSGVVNIPQALEIMRTYARRQEAQKLLDYKIETYCPQYKDGKGENAYWRAGGYFPTDQKQEFKISALFPKKATADERANFYRAFTLKCDQPWFKLDKSSTYIRGEHSANIGGTYQADRLKQPGLYVATISAYPKSGIGKSISDFKILNTVIIPHRFEASNNYELQVYGKSLKSGEYHRYFVQVPPGASAMTVELAPSAGKWCGIYGYIYNPDGITIKRMPRIDPDKKEAVSYTVAEKLTPGIWEIIPFAYHNLPKTSTYDLKISFSGFSVKGGALTDLEFENGELPGGTFHVTNNFSHFRGTASGALLGWQKRESLHISGDKHELDIKTGDNVKRVILELEMAKETWNLFTDVAVNIIAEKGKYLVSSGFSHPQLRLVFNPPKAGEYTLQIVAGFADPGKKSKDWQVSVKQIYEQKKPVSISVTRSGEKEFDLYPGIAAQLEYKLSTPPQMAPKGYSHYGHVVFKNSIGKATTAKVPLKF